MARDRSEVVLEVVNVAAFAGALLALAAGGPPHRLRPVAVFSGLGAAAALYIEVAIAFARLRARAQEASSPPRGVRLKKPLWLSAREGAPMALFVAPLAALAGVAGFPSAGAGVLIAAGALGGATFALVGTYNPQALTFEDDGLRVHLRTTTFLVPWGAVLGVARDGRNDGLVRLRFAGTEAVLGSVAPATDRARSHAFVAIGGRGEPTHELTFDAWTAGLDPAALARALAVASAREPSRVN